MRVKSITIILIFLETVLSYENEGNITITSRFSSENNKIPFGKFDIESRRTDTSTEISFNLTSNATANIEEFRKGRFIRKYDVVTCDGYMLTVIRLISKKGEVSHSYNPVLLVHGLFQSSDRFMEQSEEQSLAFKFYDLGYDVWLANTRGNKYARQHLYLEPDTDENMEFFDYDYEDIAMQDIASTVDYILNITNKEKLHYIGYSLGGTVFLVLNSLEPKYNDKFASAHLMAPFGYQNYFPHKNLTVEASRYKEIYEDLLKQGTAEIFPMKQNTTKQFLEDYCLGNETYKNICCRLEIYENMGVNSSNNDEYHTRGGSIKKLVHLAQNIKSKNFSRWDYGETENEKQYGTKVPPLYNLGLVTVETKLFHAPNDEYVSKEDILDMAKDMSNAEGKELKRADFQHKDFIFGSDVMDTVYEQILSDFKRNRSKKSTKLRSSEKTSTGLPWKILIGGLCGLLLLLLCILCVITRKKQRKARET